MAEGQDEETGQFTEGNELWRLSLNAFGRRGPLPKYTDPDDLLADCAEYFHWATNTRLPGDRPRPFLIKAMCSYIGIVEWTWERWRRERDDLKDAIAMVDQIIYVQKFEGAAADLFNSNLIAKDLGLADHHAHSGPGGGAIEFKTDFTPAERARRLAFILAEALEQAKEPTDGDS